jgi:sugar lactone lactonase YvrE
LHLLAKEKNMSQLTRLSRLGFACLLLVMVAACNNNTPPPTPTVMVKQQPELPLLNEAIKDVTQIATDKGWSPLDAVPSPDGKEVYFTANGSSGAGVYKVASTGGSFTALASGAPLVAPNGLTISNDGQTLYVADSNGGPHTGGDAIYTLSVAGGALTPIEKTVGSRPNVPEIVSENGMDMLYYSGYDNGQPAIFKLDPTKNEAATVVFKGAPLVAPSGVAVTKEGVVYVVDMAASGPELGAVFRIKAGKAEKLADQLRTSLDIAGATLTLDESALLVSNLQTEKGTAQVLLVNLSTGALGLINKGIVNNTGAGGVHRAHQVNQFAWADYSSPGRRGGSQNKADNTGGVYFLTTP